MSNIDNNIITYDNQDYFVKEIIEANYNYELKYKKKKSYYVSTFGCQMNENDSEKLSGILMQLGFCETDDIKDSDFIIFNTCCVRENAEEKVFGHLGALKALSEFNKELIIAICGCMMQQENIVEIVRKKYRHVDIIFGTFNMNKLPEYIYNVMVEGKRVVELTKDERKIVEGLPIKRDDKIKAWVTIMYGCNNFCSYCIVPYVRGRERSRNPESILAEVKMLADKGYSEITLLGQNVNSYGMELKDI